MDQNFFERTGIRNEAEDADMGKMVAKYEFDMAQLKNEEMKKLNKHLKKKPDLNDIDPDTGKLRQ